MAERPGPTARLRRISSELRALRKASGLTLREISETLDLSIPKLSRMETGQRGLLARDVATLLGFYRVPTKRREELLELVESSSEPGWWKTSGAELLENWRILLTFERNASVLYNFEPQVVPGLLQTPEYIRAVISGVNPWLAEGELDRLAIARIERQLLLNGRNAPQFLALVDETVLRRPVGEPGVMKKQLLALADSATRPNVFLRVIPFARGAHPGLRGPFLLLEFAEEAPLLHLESVGSCGYVEGEEQIRRARLAWQLLSSLALSFDESVELINSVAAEMP